MSSCSRCGAELREGARFCLACGEPVPARLSTADFLSGGVQAPAPGRAPAPPAEPPAAPGWAYPAGAPPERPQPAAAWPAPALQPRYAAPPEQPQPAAWPVAAPEPRYAAPQETPAAHYDAAVRAGAAAAPAAPIAAGDLERALARTKSYIGPAVLVFFLYALLYIPGLIINRMYLTEAQEMEQIAGRKLPGTGCLTTLLWLGILPAALLIIALFAILGGALGNLF